MVSEGSERNGILDALPLLGVVALGVLAVLLEAALGIESGTDSQRLAGVLGPDPELSPVAELRNLSWQRTSSVASALVLVMGAVCVFASITTVWLEHRDWARGRMVLCCCSTLVLLIVLTGIGVGTGDMFDGTLRLTPDVAAFIKQFAPTSLVLARVVLWASLLSIGVGSMALWLLCRQPRVSAVPRERQSELPEALQRRRRRISMVVTLYSAFFVVGVWHIHVLNVWPADVLANAGVDEAFAEAMLFEANAATLRRALLFSAILVFAYLGAEFRIFLLTQTCPKLAKQQRPDDQGGDAGLPKNFRGVIVLAAPVAMAMAQALWSSMVGT